MASKSLLFKILEILRSSSSSKITDVTQLIGHNFLRIPHKSFRVNHRLHCFSIIYYTFRQFNLSAYTVDKCINAHQPTCRMQHLMDRLTLNIQKKCNDCEPNLSDLNCRSLRPCSYVADDGVLQRNTL